MASVCAQSFERTTHHEATKSFSLTADDWIRGMQTTVCDPEKRPVDTFSDGGSTPPRLHQKKPSTIIMAEGFCYLKMIII